MHRLRCLLLSLLLAVPVTALAEPVELPAGSHFEAAFSPRGGGLELVLRSIADARHRIHVAAYIFSSKPVTQALIDAAQRGVEVRVVADDSESGSHGSLLATLAAAGIGVRSNAHYAILHDKFMVIDEATVETGSFNFTTAAARKNAENVLVISAAPALADRYQQEWQRLWDEAEPLAAPTASTAAPPVPAATLAPALLPPAASGAATGPAATGGP